MFSKTPQNSWTQIPNDSEEQKVNIDHNSTPKRLESLLKISSSSNLSLTNSPEQAEVTRIVEKTLKQMQDVCRFEDFDTIMSLVVPKVLYDLHAFDQLHEEVQTIKQSLNSYIHHSKVLSEDIAEIFLDLHNIYSKLDQSDKHTTKKPRDKKFTKRLREAEEFLKNTKHYIINDTGHEASSSMPTVPTSSQADETKDRDNDTDIFSSSETRNAERRAFLTNMIMVKKSDFSLELNRNKNYYTEAERVLKNKENSNTETS
ncbi:uncharacterized protein LOC115758664 [Drosophila novamexicana]|uniref:uncharacterized protein LOC115758664 n=1 Tax=Drosophila novamexicana TaxID=47314 RepID=UPI0011E5DCFF|nr:uncharacterized protein LOC115758664 [Drosophila novamexicana]